MRSNLLSDEATKRRSDEGVKSITSFSIPSSLRRFVASSLLVAFLTFTGCQTARVPRPLTLDHGGNDDFEQLEFWHALAGRPVTSNDEAFHGLLLFLDGTDPSGDYADRVAQLRSRRLLAAGFNQPADQAVDRGTLAVAIVRALKIPGGLTMRVFGPTPMGGRYAVRELQFMDLYPASSPNQTFSGTEFLARARELYPKTVRIVLSGFADLQTVTDAINRGAVWRFLSKPWDDEELKAVIRAAFDEADLQRHPPAERRTG